MEEKDLRDLQEAWKSNKHQEVGRLCRRLAAYYSEHGLYDKALNIYKEELILYDILNDAGGVAMARRKIGEMYCTLGQYEEALKFTDLYLEYSISASDKVEEQRAYANKGRIYLCWASQVSESGDKILLQKLVKECNDAIKESLIICKELKNIGIKERIVMNVRLLYNLCLASEIQGDINKAQTYISEAILICKNEFLSEDLVRCYLAQGVFYIKTKEYSEALQSFILAAETPTASVEQTVIILLHQAKVHFLMYNYLRAKDVLKKAYKLKSPNEGDSKIVIKKLYKAKKLCVLEKKLSETDKNDFETCEKLFEELGDTCSAVKNYKHAIKFYEKMLDCAQKNGKSGKELLPCYASLSQTYKDNEQYDLALEYSKKELKLLNNNSKEYIKALIHIGEILNFKEENVKELFETFYKAKKMAEDNNYYKEKMFILNWVYYLEIKFEKLKLAEETKKEIDLLKSSSDYSNDDCESDCEAEISEVEMQEISSDFDNDEEFDQQRMRQRRSDFKLKRNYSGETSLHTAAIRGNFERAEMLIQQGHPVKEQDSTGWTPLHNACNYGHVDIVNLLLDNGADVNDPGGSGCEGVTPLHDAASNGHFEIIDLLLKKGASTSVKTKKGETPQDSLNEWKSRSELDDDEMIIYRLYFELLKPPVEAIVARNQFNKEHRSSDAALVTENDFADNILEDLQFNAQPVPKRRKRVLNSSHNHNSVRNSPNRPSTSNTSIIEPRQVAETTVMDEVDDDMVEIQNERLSSPRMTPLPTLPIEQQNIDLEAHPSNITTSLSERYTQSFLTSPRNLTPKFFSCLINQPDKSLARALEDCESSGILDLSNLSLTCDDIAPVLKVLKDQKNLKGINLSNNAIGDEGFTLLSKCLETLKVQEINVSCNNITSVGIDYLNNTLSKIAKSLIPPISNLNISFNPIGRDSADSLKKLSKKIHNLKMDFCD